MYTAEILEYLIWPLFIVVAWFSVNYALTIYEKKFPENAGQESEQSVGK